MGSASEYILRLVEPNIKALEELECRALNAPMTSTKIYQLTLLSTMDKQKAEEAQALMTYKELDRQYGT